MTKAETDWQAGAYLSRSTEIIVPITLYTCHHADKTFLTGGQMLCNSSTNTHHLPPERHIEDAGQQKAEEKHPPVCCDEGKQGKHHVAQSKGKINTNSGIDFPNPWA